MCIIIESLFLVQVTGLSASFGEMLLLMAIHFHSNQLSAIGDLVCQTLGMKIVIRTNSMSRKISHVFTHEIFNEQVGKSIQSDKKFLSQHQRTFKFVDLCPIQDHLNSGIIFSI